MIDAHLPEVCIHAEKWFCCCEERIGSVLQEDRRHPPMKFTKSSPALSRLPNRLTHFAQMCCERPSLSLTFTSSRSASRQASFCFTAEQLNRVTACLVGIAARHRQHKQVAQNAINRSVVNHVHDCTHPQRF